MIRNGWTQRKLDFVLEHMEKEEISRSYVLSFWKWMTGNYGLWFALTADRDYLNGLLNLYERYTYFDAETSEWSFSMNPRRDEAARRARMIDGILEPSMLVMHVPNVDDEVRRRIGRKNIG